MFVYKWLAPLLNADGDMGAASAGVEVAPAAEEHSQVAEVDASQPGVEPEAAAEPEKLSNFEKAFAKRLAAKEAEWKTQNDEKYKGHDDYKRAAEYLQKTTGIADIMTLREEIELAELQERAEKENVPTAVLKRIDELEAKAAEGDELKSKQQQEEQWKQFEDSLKEFAKDKEIDGKTVDHMELWKYMHENEVSKPDVAFKAMKADALEMKLATAREDSVKDYLASKQAPKVEGSVGSAGTQSVDTSKMSWKEIQRHTAARLEASKTPQ